MTTTTFRYAGRTRSGAPVAGERAATSVDAAVEALRREDIFVTRIDAVEAPRAARRRRARAGRPVPPKRLAVFTRQLAVMIDAGLPLVESLEVLGTQEEDAGFRETILAVRAHVEGGVGLAAALARYPGAFDTLYVNMIAAGEAGGVLDVILQRLATYIETSVKLRAQVRAALAYPAAVVAIAAVVVAGVLWKVIPAFTSLFAGLGATLPLPTRVVMAASDGFAVAFPLLLLGSAAGAVWLRRLYRTPRGRRLVDAALLRAPAFGPVLRKVAVARFCRTLATLLSAGVPILEALEITARTAGNAVVEGAVLTARSSIESGEPVSAPLRQTQVFPILVTQMIHVGETTGAHRHDAGADRELLRGGGRSGGGRHAGAARAAPDRLSRDRRRRHRGRPVPADLRAHQQDGRMTAGQGTTVRRLRLSAGRRRRRGAARESSR